MTLSQLRLCHSKLGVRRLHDFDLNEAIDVYDYFSHIFSIAIVKVLNTLINQGFSSWYRKN